MLVLGENGFSPMSYVCDGRLEYNVIVREDSELDATAPKSELHHRSDAIANHSDGGYVTVC